MHAATPNEARGLIDYQMDSRCTTPRSALGKQRSAIRAPRKAKASAGMVTLKAWRARIKAAGEKALPAGDPIFEYADSVGLDPEMLSVAWHNFVVTYTEDRDTKLYVDWRKVFRRSVRENWHRLWFIDPVKKTAAWTSRGLQAQAAYRAIRQPSG